MLENNVNNRKILIKSIGAIIAVVVIIVIAKLVLNIGHPFEKGAAVFLENNYDLTVNYADYYYEDEEYDYDDVNGYEETSDIYSQFSLIYLANKNSDLRVQDIIFSGCEDLCISVYDYEEDYYTYNNYNQLDMFYYNNDFENPQYDIRAIQVCIDSKIGEREYKSYDLSEAEVFYTDGSSEVVDLGNIILNIEEDDYDGETYTEWISSHASSDNSYGVTLIVLDTVSLENIEMPEWATEKSDTDISINGEAIEDVIGNTYYQGDSLNIEVKCSGFIDKFSNYNFTPKLRFEDKDGNEFYIETSEISYSPYEYSILGTYMYLKSRGRA